MLRSTERFLTTHVGSLPRTRDLTLTMRAREDGVPVDKEALRARVQQVVRDIVKRQLDIGVDIVNDGDERAHQAAKAIWPPPLIGCEQETGVRQFASLRSTQSKPRA